jgi:hypothetical protein
MDAGKLEISPAAATFLSTEHWHLLGTRSMAWNESFSRASIFLNTLSAFVVALALVANVSGFGRSFSRFAIVLFPIVLFLGITTYVRLVRINLNDSYIVAAMNRLRRAYIDAAPEIAPYFTSGTTDDMEGMYQSILLGQMSPKTPLPHIIVTTPTLLLVVNAIIGAAGAAFAAQRAGASDPVIAVVSLVVALVVGFGLWRVQARAAREMLARAVRFPSA